MASMMRRVAFALVLAIAAGSGFAQGKKQQMSPEERQRMRDDVRDAYHQRQDRPPPQQKARQQMSPEERGKLRRDIEDANKNLKR
jgi:hypothetical protein